MLGAAYYQDINAHAIDINGAPGVEVVIRATVPALGLGGPSVEVTVRGTAIEESVP